MDYHPPYWPYGGMKPGQNTKLHICDNHGNVFCGVQSNWMEAAYDPLPDDGYVEGYFKKVTDMDFACKKCVKKWQKLKEDEHNREGSVSGSD